jgi:hypothetical protein
MSELSTAVSFVEGERTCLYRVLRYAPYRVRDEWVNIGVLLFDPRTGERRLRLMESQDEFARVRRLHPTVDEELLRGLRDDLEDRFQGAAAEPDSGGWQKLLAKWDDTLSNALQLAPQKGVFAADLDAELERLYADHVAPQHAASRVGAPGSRATMRGYCGQVWKLARLWDRLDKSVRVAEFTLPGDPMRVDYSYRRNGTRGYVQTLSVSRAPADCKLYAYTAARIASRAPFASEFAAVTDVPLRPENERHRFVRDTLRDAGIEPVAMESFAVWVNKLKPLLLQ